MDCIIFNLKLFSERCFCYVVRVDKTIEASVNILKYWGGETHYAYQCIHVHVEQNKLAALSEYDDHSVVCLFNFTDSFFLTSEKHTVY